MSLPLSYCTNVHPGLTVAQVESGLRRYTCVVRDLLEKGQRPQGLAAGLWLAAPVIREILSVPDGIQRFAQRLRESDLPCYTLNAFPYGDFHSERVKEGVYVPDWTSRSRLDYTLDCARVLAALLPEGVDGSISTVPLGFKRLAGATDFTETCVRNLMELATELNTLKNRTGRTVRLAIEPEPLCVLETTGETVEFFRRLRARAAAAGIEPLAIEFLGVCYDVCHQSVEFEDIAQSIGQLEREAIRINKVHLSCALQLDDPQDNAARAALARYAEPRYLHQTFARGADGQVRSIEDLSPAFALHPPAEYAAADSWRIHFHVPVDAERLGPLATTRADLIRAVGRVARLPYRPHLEVETYTWEVLPGEGPRVALVDGLTRELVTTYALLDSVGL